jgi:hypothetical protein
MGLFTNKPNTMGSQSSVKKLPSLPDLPEFPEIPEDDHMGYESTIQDIKRGIDNDQTKEEPSHPMADDFQQPISRPQPVMAAPGEDKPLFVKIDQYKVALAELDKLKQKAAEAETLLEQIESVRADESSKLESWKKEVGAIKEKLLSVDRTLFEV